MSKAALTALALGVLGVALIPQGSADSAPPAPASHAAAAELCRLLYSPTRYQQSLDLGSDLLIENLAKAGHPVPAERRAAVRQAVGETASYQAMVDQTATLFANQFSLSELQDLVAFYRTRTGQRSLQLPQILERSSAEFGRSIATRISPKLRALGLSVPDPTSTKQP